MQRRTWATPFVVVLGCGHAQGPPEAVSRGSGSAVVVGIPAIDGDAPRDIGGEAVVEPVAVDAGISPVDAAAVRPKYQCLENPGPEDPICNPPRPRFIDGDVTEQSVRSGRACFLVSIDTHGVTEKWHGDFVAEGKVIAGTRFRLQRIVPEQVMGCLDGQREKLPSSKVRLTR